MVRSSGPRTASTMQNSEAPRAAVSRAAASTSSRVEEGRGLAPACRSGTTASRSGSPRGSRRSWPRGSPRSRPRARTRPSRTWWASDGQCHDGAVGEGGQRGELVAGQEAALVEQGALGGRRSRPVPPRSGRLGAGALRCPQRWSVEAVMDADVAQGHAARVGTAHTVVAGWGPPVADRRQGGAAMAWDFSTEPEFEEKLEWMRGFVREEVFPLETLELTYDQVRAVDAAAAGAGQGAGAVGGPPAAGARRHGLRAGQAGPDARDPRAVAAGPRASSATTRPTRATPSCWRSASRTAATRSSGARWLQPLLDGELRSAFSMTEPNTAGSDPTLLTTSAVRDGDE